MKSNESLEEEVIIKLKRWHIPLLLGAARLGIWVEDWCAALVQTDYNCYDTHSGKWILRIGHIIKQIKEQTEVKEEEKEYGYDYALQQIQKMVDEQCQKNTENWFKYQEEEHKAYQEKEKTPEDLEVEEKLKKQIISVPITDEAIRKVGEWVEKVEAEKI